MENIFASLNQYALFPMTISLPPISKEQYHGFYEKDRTLFTTLLQVLHYDVVQSIQVMGFLVWLERGGYNSKGLVVTILNYLDPDRINLLANDVVTCLKLLETKKPTNYISADIWVLKSFLDQKRLNLEEIYHNRDSIFDQVSCIANDLSNKAFDDILEPFIPYHEPSVDHTRQEAGGVVGGFRNRYAGFHHLMMGKEIYVRQQRNISGLGNRSQSKSIVPPENRTVFLTFSKGYPISEYELRDHFLRMFGDFMETIIMQSVEPENQPLYARIVARSPSMVSVVVNKDGADGKSKYYINGKHVWARKFEKRATNDASGGVA